MASKKVLIVDDDADFVEINRSVLEADGYEVVAAYNGKECLEKVESEKPDLIVLDIMMTTPGEGMYVAQDLRQNEATKRLPIIVTTSVNQEPEYSLGPDEAWLPVDSFMEKPVTPEKLLEEVKKKIGN